ncbi:MAG: class I SAM-dependent methyltransferase [Candidatus Ornithospirochaeta sp.]|nr:class I SAM-dependent methyltransferase [Sphaerochaetaceae bacterium]MDY5523357.1 class I SAM-dependent methyltransferase [Candidatus Ornithospirochaeta sp.]
MDVQDYLRRINVKKYKKERDFFCALNKSTEDKEAIQRVIEIISNRADDDTNDDVYNAKNKYLSLAKVINGNFDYSHYMTSLQWISDHSDLFGKTILDVGCDIGITSCFIASLLPESKVIGIDTSENGVRCAWDLAKELNLKNVSFECINLNSISLDEKYDTVLSSKVFHENGGIIDYNPCTSMDEMADLIASSFRKYARALARHVKDEGNCITIEKLGRAELPWGWIQIMNRFGLVFNPENTSRYKCKEANRDSRMFAFEFKKGDSLEKDDLYKLYNTSFHEPMNTVTGKYEKEVASLLWQNSARSLIWGYDIYFDDLPTYRYGFFRTDDLTGFIHYFNSYYMEDEDAPIVYNYDIKKLDAVIKLNESEIQALVKRGFTIKRIEGWVPKYQQTPAKEILSLK